MKTRSNSVNSARLTLFLFSRNPNDHPKGYMLFLVVSLLITLSGLLVAYAILAKVHSLSIKNTATGNSGFYGAEGALNIRAQELRKIFLTEERDPSGTSPASLDKCIDQTGLGSGDYKCKVTSFPSPDDATAKINVYSYISGGGASVEGTVPPGDTFQGLNMLENSYKISAVSAKENASSGDIISSVGMAIKSRQIPMFQFAAFYLNDLEILPGPDMTLGGPVHTNASLFLGANNVLAITGQVTVGQDLFNRRKNDNSTYPNGRVRIANSAGTLINLLQGGTGSTAQTTAAMIPANVNATWGTQVQLGVEALSIPTISSLGAGGNYAQQADINFVYAPEKTSVNVPGIGTTIIPFNVTATKRNATGTGAPTTLNNAQLASLRQPVLATGTAVTAGVCAPVGEPVTTGLTATQITLLRDPDPNSGVANALRRGILSQTTPVPFSVVNSNLNTSPLNSTNGVRDQIEAILLPSNSTERNRIRGYTPNQIAAFSGKCFISAPIQHPNTTGYNGGVSFINNRERSPGNNFRTMRLMQINIESLTVWNFQGRYLNDAGTGLVSANQLLFATAAADNAAPANSFQRLGLAGSDISNNGLVFHATVSTNADPSPNTNASPYGFALVRGGQLPGLGESSTDPTGLTFVSDQAVYMVGDYNITNWQPASILADSLNVLSRRCINTNGQIFKGNGTGCGGNAFDTTINSAFLSGTDITNSTTTPGYNGGLENYPRFHETWGTLTYTGSFVSTGTPEKVTGRWTDQLYGAPTRIWAYETRFNNARNLPPMSPRFVFIKQENFSRSFDQ